MYPLSPRELELDDIEKARRDSRHRAKKLEDAINSALRGWWFRVSRWALKQGAKGKDRRNTAEYRGLTKVYNQRSETT